MVKSPVPTVLSDLSYLRLDFKAIQRLHNIRRPLPLANPPPFQNREAQPHGFDLPRPSSLLIRSVDVSAVALSSLSYVPWGNDEDKHGWQGQHIPPDAWSSDSSV